MLKVPAVLFSVIFLTAAVSATAADAVAVLAEYASEFHQSGRRLIMVVVPPRETELTADYCDLQKRLHTAGVESIALDNLFADISASDGSCWCTTDTHPAPAAVAVMAHTVAEYLTNGTLPEPGEKIFQLLPPCNILCSGNLGGEETLEFVPVSGSTVVPDSDIWVTGDSNALIYHDGIDLPVKNAGFADYLAYYLDSKVSLLAIRGNSADSIRGEMYRRSLQSSETGFAKMRTTIFILSYEQFTGGANRWRKIPAPTEKMETPSCEVRKI